MDVRVGLERKLSTEELMLLNCGVGENSWESLGQQGDQEAETPILRPPDVKNWLIWKDPDAGKAWRQEVKGTTEGEMVMASPTQWTWVSVNSGSWWWIGRPGMVQSMGSQRVGHDWATELNWKSLRISFHCNMRSRSKILSSKWGPSGKMSP